MPPPNKEFHENEIFVMPCCSRKIHAQCMDDWAAARKKEVEKHAREESSNIESSNDKSANTAIDSTGVARLFSVVRAVPGLFFYPFILLLSECYDDFENLLNRIYIDRGYGH